jgi:hypothetical protein
MTIISLDEVNTPGSESVGVLGRETSGQNNRKQQVLYLLVVPISSRSSTATGSSSNISVKAQLQTFRMDIVSQCLHTARKLFLQEQYYSTQNAPEG